MDSNNTIVSNKTNPEKSFKIKHISNKKRFFYFNYLYEIYK